MRVYAGFLLLCGVLIVYLTLKLEVVVEVLVNFSLKGSFFSEGGMRREGSVWFGVGVLLSTFIFSLVLV